jgi:ATP-dependent helicase/nuclease subunit A
LQPEVVADQVRCETESAMEEENRLLYVAMTRARDQLYVCGAGDPDKLKDGCWYAKVQAMMVVQGHEVTDENGALTAWRLGKIREADTRIDITSAPAPLPALAPWMRRAAPPEPPEPRPLAPSRLDFELADGVSRAVIKEQPAASPLAHADGAGFLRGRLIHRLLQTLPDIPATKHDTAMERYLSVYAQELPAGSADGIKNEIAALLGSDDPGLRALFGSGSIAEAPVTGRLPITGPGGKPIIISGVVDRIAILENEILLVDFKTNKEPPADVNTIPVAYTRQLAAYGLALRQIYPGHSVRAWLVWTQNAHIMEVPQQLLDTAFS